MISERPRIAADSMSVASRLGGHVFLRESAAGLSVTPPAMCHMVAVNQVGVGGKSIFGYCHICSSDSNLQICFSWAFSEILDLIGNFSLVTILC